MIVDIKVGSSEAGASPNPGSHHPERSGVIRTFSAYGHRHTAEVIQELGLPDVHLTMTSVDLVRGALAAAHAFVKPGVAEKDLWRAYRAWAESEPSSAWSRTSAASTASPSPRSWPAAITPMSASSSTRQRATWSPWRPSTT